jgi:hypothetical protein
MAAISIIIEVTAGLIPGQAMQKYTKQFIITSDVWHAEGTYENKQEEAKLEILKTYGFAQEYARSLMNPQALNWVNMNWICL